MRKYEMYHDPSHGWLAVPSKDLLEMGLQEQISPYSYMSPSGLMVYLEEDCDAGKFREALEAKGIDYMVSHKRSNRQARCRSYQAYVWK